MWRFGDDASCAGNLYLETDRLTDELRHVNAPIIGALMCLRDQLARGAEIDRCIFRLLHGILQDLGHHRTTFSDARNLVAPPFPLGAAHSGSVQADCH